MRLTRFFRFGGDIKEKVGGRVWVGRDGWFFLF